MIHKPTVTRKLSGVFGRFFRAPLQKNSSGEKGDFIWIAESDDFCDSFSTRNCLSHCGENRKVALSYCQSNRVDRNGFLTQQLENTYTDI
jgi:hypothetical protein